MEHIMAWLLLTPLFSLLWAFAATAIYHLYLAYKGKPNMFE